ncbi:MAG: tetratricopeptide repeat protein [Xenococcaceae cyanobacterium MO_188.B19]|nr:tetratricopeptide repeat protein [Xenococcaceae cyanobacterium MO_188.B19]
MTELSNDHQEPILMTADNVRNSVYAESEIWRGLKLEQQGYLEKAISCYRQAVRLYPESSEARDILALALRKQSQIQNKGREPDQLLNNNHQNNFNSQLSITNQEGRIVLRKGREKLQNESFGESGIILPSIKSSSSIVNLRQSQPRIAQIYVEQAYAYMEKQQFESAIVACQNAIDLEPQMAEAYKVWGNALYALGKSAEAMGYYAKALEIQPDMSEVYANLGTLFAKQKKWQQAIEYLEISLVYNPEFAGSYRNLAKIWEELGETDKAWSCMEKALDLEPELITPGKYVEFANELLREQEWGKAIAFYNYALRLKPNFQEARMRLAQILEKLGRREEAKLHYKKLLEIQNQPPNPITKLPQKKLINTFLATSQKKSASPKKNLINSQGKTLPTRNKVNPISPKGLREQNLLANSSQSLNQGLKKPESTIDAEIKNSLSPTKEQPNSAEIEFNLGNSSLKKQQWQEAIAHYQKAIKLNPKLGAAYQNLAQIYRKIGKDAEAIDFYYRFCTLEPDMISAEKYLNLGGVLLKRKQLKRAKSCFQKAIQKQPNYSEAYHCLGDVFVQQEKWQEAIAAYSKAIQINPEFSWSYHNLGDVWLKLENWSQAVENFQKAIALKDDFIWSHHNLGDAFSRLFQWDNAIAAYRKAIELKPDFAEAYAHLGDALIRQENWDEGIKNYEKAIEINPGIDVSVYRNLKEALDRKKYLGAELGGLNHL